MVLDTLDEGQSAEVEADSVRENMGPATSKLQLADSRPQELAPELEGEGQVASVGSRDHENGKPPFDPINAESDRRASSGSKGRSIATNRWRAGG
jgi:hypothetical protein